MKKTHQWICRLWNLSKVYLLQYDSFYTNRAICINRIMFNGQILWIFSMSIGIECGIFHLQHKTRCDFIVPFTGQNSIQRLWKYSIKSLSTEKENESFVRVWEWKKIPCPMNTDDYWYCSTPANPRVVDCAFKLIFYAVKIRNYSAVSNRPILFKTKTIKFRFTWITMNVKSKCFAFIDIQHLNKKTNTQNVRSVCSHIKSRQNLLEKSMKSLC